MANQTITYNNNNAWTVPANCYRVNVECWGGGGGASASNSTTIGGGGGGGGAYARSNNITVTPGAVLSMVVGAGGSAGAGNNNGANGVGSGFNNNQVYARFGNAANRTGANGAGGTVGNNNNSGNGCVGQFCFAGGRGNNSTGTVGGGGGAAAGNASNGANAANSTGATGANNGGSGGSGGANNANGSNGVVPGGGGGGSGGSNAAGKNGGNGAAGQIILTWTPGYSLSAATGAATSAGAVATPHAYRKLRAVTGGAATAAGQVATLSKGKQISAATGAATLAGGATSINASGDRGGGGGSVIIGHNTTPSADDTNPGLVQSMKCTLSQTATLQSLSIYVTGINGKMPMGIYSNNAGSPGTLLAQTNAATSTPSSNNNWFSQNTTSNPSLSPGDYWIAWQQENGSRFGSNGSGTTCAYHTMVYNDTFPGAFGSVDGSGDFGWFAYATLTLAGGGSVTHTLSPLSGSVTAAGAAATITKSTAGAKSISAVTGAIAVSGQAATPKRTAKLTAATGSITGTGQTTSIDYKFVPATQLGSGNSFAFTSPADRQSGKTVYFWFSWDGTASNQTPFTENHATSNDGIQISSTGEASLYVDGVTASPTYTVTANSVYGCALVWSSGTLTWYIWAQGSSPSAAQATGAYGAESSTACKLGLV